MNPVQGVTGLRASWPIPWPQCSRWSIGTLCGNKRRLCYLGGSIHWHPYFQLAEGIGVAQNDDTIAPYQADAARFADQYESLATSDVHAAYLELLPRSGDGTALDVGAGSGRDAAWLASIGYHVTAVEPAKAMRQEAKHRHPEESIQWLDDWLPGLTQVQRQGVSYDFILLSVVWMHVKPNDRGRAFRKLVTLLKPGGVLVITLARWPNRFRATDVAHPGRGSRSLSPRPRPGNHQNH